MALNYVKFDKFVEDLAHKAHNLGGDALNIALVAAANAPDAAADGVLADLTLASTTNLVFGGLTRSGSGQSGGVYTLSFNDTTLKASGGTVGPFRYIVLYNDTSVGDKLIGYYDRGGDLTLYDGETLTLQFSGLDVITIE